MYRLFLVLLFFVAAAVIVMVTSTIIANVLKQRHPGPLMASPATVLGCRCELPPGAAMPILQSTDPQAISLRYVPGASSPTYYASFGLPAGQVLELPVDSATAQLLSVNQGMTGQLTWRDGHYVGFQPQDLR